MVTLVDYIKDEVCRLPKKHARVLIVACEADVVPQVAYTFCQAYRRKTVEYDDRFHEAFGDAVWRATQRGHKGIRVGTL